MKNLKWTGLLAGAMALGIVSPALSHHSHAMYDHTKQISVTGTVSKFVYTNPHVSLYIDVKGEDGEVVNYWIEMSNLTQMVQRGIGKATFQLGDKVTVNLHPLKDGRPGGNYITIVAADGKTYE